MRLLLIPLRIAIYGLALTIGFTMYYLASNYPESEVVEIPVKYIMLLMSLLGVLGIIAIVR